MDFNFGGLQVSCGISDGCSALDFLCFCAGFLVFLRLFSCISALKLPCFSFRAGFLVFLR